MILVFWFSGISALWLQKIRRFVLGLSCKLFDFLCFELRMYLTLQFCFFVSTQTNSEKSTQHHSLMVVITSIMVRRSSYLIFQSTASVGTSWCIVIASACHGLLASFLLICKEHFPQAQRHKEINSQILFLWVWSCQFSGSISRPFQYLFGEGNYTALWSGKVWYEELFNMDRIMRDYLEIKRTLSSICSNHYS